MKEERIDLWESEEYGYGAAFGFIPNLHCYLHEGQEEFPCMVVVPGGGYRVVSPSEGEIVAKAFYDMGYNAFVLTYTTNLLDLSPLHLQPLQDLSRAIRKIRKDAKKYHIDTKRIIACGFSAGGHLVGSLCVHWEEIEDQNTEYMSISNKVDAAILSYPVITSGDFAHQDSFRALCGESPKTEELEYMSLENHVTENTPPIFLWQTITDELVPVENSILMARSLKEKDIPFSLHLFTKGKHGMSLANETWAFDGMNTGQYTMEQIAMAFEALKSGKIPMTDDKLTLLKIFELPEEEIAQMSENKSNKSIELWTSLAKAWIEEVFENRIVSD